jgi:hypothetical protein
MTLGSSDPSLITNCVNAYVLLALKQYRPCGLRGVDCSLFRRRTKATAASTLIPLPAKKAAAERRV